MADQPAPQPQPETPSIEALAQLTLTYTSEGGIHMGVAGDLRPSIAWALAEFLRNVGDDMFRVAKEEALAKARASAQRIVVPGADLSRVR